MSYSSKLNENSKAKNAEIQAKTANSSEMNAIKVSAEDATNEFFGYFVQLDCGDDGKYQGFITEVQPATDGTSAWGKVKLEKPLRNGDPFGSEDMAIMVPGELIQEIKVLYMPEASTEKPKPVKTLPQKSKSNLKAGFQPVKKVPQYTPKTSSTSLNNKSNPASKFTNVHYPTPFNLLSRNSSSNISVSRRPPSVAQSLLKMKPPAVHDAQILSNIKNKEPQMRANAKPFVPRSILVRPKKILSITPPPNNNKEATTSKKAAQEVMAKSEEEKKEGKKERTEKKQKTSKKESNKSAEAGDETKPKEKKKSKRSTKEKGVVDSVENGEERVKKPKKKKSTTEEGEGSSKMKGGKDERNRLAKEKRANKNTDEKVRKKKDKEEKKDETVINETEQLKNKEEEEEKPTEESASEKKEEEPPLNEKAKEQIEEELNQVEENYVEKIAEEIYGINKLEEEDEMLITEEELRNEVAEILENVSTGIGNMTIENIDDLNETAEMQTNTSSSTLANRTMTSSDEEFDEDDKEPARPEEFTGKLASINTDVGLYQGIVAAVDPINRTIKLEKPLLDGYPLGAKFIELECSAMKKIIIFGNGNGSNSNSCYATPNRNVREWNGRKGGRRSYSPSSAANTNRPYSPNVNQQNAPQQSPPKPRDQQPFPLNAATMSNQQIFMRSMPQPPVDHQRQSMDYQQHQQLATTVQSPNADGKRHNFGNGKNNNRQSPTRPAAEWSHHRQSPRTFIRRSVPPTSSTPPAQLAHEEYGDYKKFIQPQVPTPPVRPRTNNTNNNSSRHCGPTGIPAMDCMNGYSEVLNSEESTILGAPLDHAALNVDFDFASNLALFDKKEFVKKTEHTFYGLNTGGNNSRNYRNDENVLIDPSRVTSWVSTPSTSNSNWLYGQPNIANAAGQTGRDNHHRMQQQYSRSKPSTKTD